MLCFKTWSDKENIVEWSGSQTNSPLGHLVILHTVVDNYNIHGKL
jgi:hypothetical protein